MTIEGETCIAVGRRFGDGLNIGAGGIGSAAPLHSGTAGIRDPFSLDGWVAVVLRVVDGELIYVALHCAGGGAIFGDGVRDGLTRQYHSTTIDKVDGRGMRAIGQHDNCALGGSEDISELGVVVPDLKMVAGGPSGG